MAKLKAYNPSIGVDLIITVLKDKKEVAVHTFQNLTYTDMTEKELKKQQDGREDFFKSFRKFHANLETIRLLNIKMDGLEDTESNKKAKAKISTKLLVLREKNDSLTDKMNAITDANPDKFKNIAEDEFKLSIGGEDLEELVKVIESKVFDQLTYSSALELLKEDAKEKKGN